MELRLNALTKTYGKKAAVRDVTACLTPGIYGLLGPNGAGKTTLMNMMCGILRPSKGTVLFDGKEISLESHYGWEHKIDYDQDGDNDDW